MDGSGGRVRGYWGFSGVGRLRTLAVAGCRYHRHHANEHYTEHIGINDRTGWKHGDKDDKDAKQQRFPWVYILPSAMVPKFLVFANYDGSSSAPHGISHKSGHRQLAATTILHLRYFTFLLLEDPTIFFFTETLLSVWSGDKCYFSINKTLFSSLVE